MSDLPTLLDVRTWPMTSREASRFTAAYVAYAKWSPLSREQLPVGFLNAITTLRRTRKAVRAYKRMMAILNAAKKRRFIPDDIRIEARLDRAPACWAIEGSVR